jgi:hypothetical protein
MQSLFEDTRPTIDATHWSAALVVVVQNELAIGSQRFFRVSRRGGKSGHLGESDERPPAYGSHASL